MNTFYNQMFNPQYVNLQYYRQIEQMQYQAKQNEEVSKAVKNGYMGILNRTRYKDTIPF